MYYTAAVHLVSDRVAKPTISRVFLAFTATVLVQCKSPPTMALFTLDTDLARDQALAVRVRVSREGDSVATYVALQPSSDGGMDGGQGSDAAVMPLQFPASFTVVPSGGGRTEQRVTVDFQVTSTLGTFTTQRRFTFVRGQPMSIPVYLSRDCATPAVGCRTLPCTTAVLCSERNLTCGNNGECIDAEVLPIPVLDWQDVRVSFGRDHSAVDRDTFVPNTDAMTVTDVQSMDIPTIDVANQDVPNDLGCVPNCAGRVCGSDGCGGTCGPGCSAIQQCDAMGTCHDVRCSIARQDVYRHVGNRGIFHYTNSPNPPAGGIAGPRIFALWRDPGPRLRPIYYCNALDVIGWVSTEAACEGQPATGVLIGYGGDALPLAECATWGYRINRCDQTEQLSITVDRALHDRLIAMNPGGRECICGTPGCVYHADGWENTVSFLP